MRRLKRQSLAYKGVSRIPPDFEAKAAPSCDELDLSHNKIKDMMVVSAFERITVLILDHNHISEKSGVPRLPQLSVLWMNHNRVANLAAWVDKLVAALPCLTHLSMLGNDACPTYHAGASKARYTDYRHYVISRFPKLLWLEDTPVSQEERDAAKAKYGAVSTQSEYERTIALQKKRARRRAARERRRAKEAAQVKAEETEPAILRPADVAAEVADGSLADVLPDVHTLSPAKGVRRRGRKPHTLQQQLEAKYRPPPPRADDESSEWTDSEDEEWDE